MSWLIKFKFCVIFIVFLTLNLVLGEKLSECLQNASTSKWCQDFLPYARAAEIKSFMKQGANPCEDFYEFACGDFTRSNPALSKPTTGFFESLSEGVTLKVKRVLNSPASVDETDYDKLTKSFYQSCMKLIDISLEEHFKSYKKIIAEFGIMPVLAGPNWNANYNFDWIEVLGKMQQKYGISTIISAGIMSDFKDNTRNRIYFGQAELPLISKSMYFSAETEEYRERYVEKLALQLHRHFQVPNSKAKEVAKSMLDFEQMLAKGMLDDNTAKSMDEQAKLTTPKNVTAKYGPNLNVSRFLELAYNETIDDEFYECGEEFLLNVKEVMSKVPKETVANYIFYQLVSEFFPKAAVEQKYQQTICTDMVKKHFAKLLDNMVYRRNKPERMEKDINEMWQKMKESFRRKLNSDELQWMSPEVLERAHLKLDAMKLEINSYASTNFTEEMHGLTIDSENFIENLKHIFAHNSQRMIKKLHELPTPFEADEELSYTPVNMILENTIKIPVSLLQPFYLWSEHYPEALMYGTLGFLIGHELVHGFDDNGREYDETGNQREWWDEESTEVFVNRTECFKQQYHRYKFGNSYLPLSESQAENIADNGGLRIAYDAYVNWLDDEAREGRYDSQLPQLEAYSSKKLFFISYAQIWCSDTAKGLIGLQTATDEHTPGKFRVIGVLSNSEEFADTFECKIGTNMNPDSKCVIY